jgi:hypothetical protein
MLETFVCEEGESKLSRRVVNWLDESADGINNLRLSFVMPVVRDLRCLATAWITT